LVTQELDPNSGHVIASCHYESINATLMIVLEGRLMTGCHFCFMHATSARIS
jgi:hypothetical protein